MNRLTFPATAAALAISPPIFAQARPQVLQLSPSDWYLTNKNPGSLLDSSVYDDSSDCR